MAGLSFLTPVYLIGAASIALPILIHLYFRRRYRRMLFTTVRFLRDTASDTARRLRVREMLLLLLRILLLLLFAFALAQPVMKFTHSGFLTAGGSTAAVILIDNSMSMSRIVNSRPVFDEAKKVAAEALSSLSRGDRCLIDFPCNPTIVASPAFTDKWKKDDVNTARLTYHHSDVGSSLQRAYQLLSQQKAANKEIYVITDMQSSEWQSLTQRQAQVRIDPQVTLYLVDVGGRTVDNRCVTNVSCVGSPGVIDKPTTLRATVQNFGAAVEDKATLVIDGRKVQERAVALPADGTGSVTFKYAFATPGLHTGYVEVGPDTLSADDRCWFGLNVKTKLPVLIVCDRQGVMSPAFYLRAALLPGMAQGLNQETRIQPLVMQPEALARIPLEQFSAVVIVGVKRLPEDSVNALFSFVRSGGGVLFALDAAADAKFYNERLYAQGKGILPLTLTTSASRRTAYTTFGDIDASAPVFQSFEPWFADTLLNSQFSDTASMSVENASTDGSSPRVIARFTDNRPALVEKAYGRGKVMVFASNLGADSSDFPLQGSYVPFVNRLTYYLCRSDDATTICRVGETVQLNSTPTRESVTVISPEGTRSCPINSIVSSTDVPGVYRVTGGHEQASPQFFTVRIDPRESDLTRTTPRAVKSLLPRATLLYVGDRFKLEKVVQEARHGVAMDNRFLYVALLLLLVECALANAWSQNRGQLKSPD